MNCLFFGCVMKKIVCFLRHQKKIFVVAFFSLLKYTNSKDKKHKPFPLTQDKLVHGSPLMRCYKYREFSFRLLGLIFVLKALVLK